MDNRDSAAPCLRVLELLGSGAYTPIEEGVIRLCAAFDPNHYEITLVYPYNGPFAQHTSHLRCDQTIIGIWEHLDWYSLSALVQLIKQKRIDLLHAHLPQAVQLGAVAARLSGIPCVATLYQPPSYAEQRTAEVCPVIWVAASEAIRQASEMEITEVIHLPAISLHQTFVRAGYDLPADAPLVAYTGRLDEAGGVDRFVDAALQLLSTLPHVHWLVIGNGPLEYELRRKAQPYRQIHFLSSAPDLLSASDLAVFPAREAMLAPRAMDLMVAGIPVIASRTGIYPELMPFEYMLFSGDDPCSLETAIEAYFTDPVKYRSSSRQLQQQAQRLWSPAAAAGHYSDLFRRV